MTQDARASATQTIAQGTAAVITAVPDSTYMPVPLERTALRKPAVPTAMVPFPLVTSTAQPLQDERMAKSSSQLRKNLTLFAAMVTESIKLFMPLHQELSNFNRRRKARRSMLPHQENGKVPQ
jgi:hypothetical protein